MTAQRDRAVPVARPRENLSRRCEVTCPRHGIAGFRERLGRFLGQSHGLFLGTEQRLGHRQTEAAPGVARFAVQAGAKLGREIRPSCAGSGQVAGGGVNHGHPTAGPARVPRIVTAGEWLGRSKAPELRVVVAGGGPHARDTSAAARQRFEVQLPFDLASLDALRVALQAEGANGDAGLHCPLAPETPVADESRYLTYRANLSAGRARSGQTVRVGSDILELRARWKRPRSSGKRRRTRKQGGLDPIAEPPLWP